MIDDSLYSAIALPKGVCCIGPGTGALRCAHPVACQVCCCFPKSLHDFEIWKRVTHAMSSALLHP